MVPVVTVTAVERTKDRTRPEICSAVSSAAGVPRPADRPVIHQVEDGSRANLGETPRGMEDRSREDVVALVTKVATDREIQEVIQRGQMEETLMTMNVAGGQGGLWKSRT